MKPLTWVGLICWVTVSGICVGQSPFNGTWRPDPQRPEPGRKPDVFQLLDGEYDCQSCDPPYKVRADGADHAVAGNPRFDKVRVAVVSERKIIRTASKDGAVVVQSTEEVSPDGRTLVRRQILSATGPRKVDFMSRSSRVSAGPQGSHAISGSWHLIEADLTHHDEDTDYRVVGNTLTMSDHMGRSFTANLDGTDAPYKGDPDFTAVSVRLIDERTLEESDKNGDKVVKVTRWSVDPDGKTMRVTFDDTHGHIQHQTGRKIK